MNKKQLKVKMIGITLFSAIFLGGSIYGFTQMNSDQGRNQSTAEESTNGFKPMERSQDSQSAIDSVKKAQSNTEQNKNNPIDQMKENVSNLTKEAKDTADGIKNEL